MDKDWNARMKTDDERLRDAKKKGKLKPTLSPHKRWTDRKKNRKLTEFEERTERERLEVVK